MPARDQRVVLACAVGTLALLLPATVLGHAEFFAYAAPLLVVALPLLAGRYPGEDRLERLRANVARPRAARVAGRPAPVRRSPVHAPRGGRLIAHALAERAPPVPAPA